MSKTLRTISACLSLSLVSVALAADPPASGTRPLLKQLNEETQSLYREIQSGVVRVQLPPPKGAGQPLAEADNPLNKWGNQVDADVKHQLEQEQKAAQKGQGSKTSATVGAAVATQPATQANRGQQSATKPGAVGAWTV